MASWGRKTSRRPREHRVQELCRRGAAQSGVGLGSIIRGHDLQAEGGTGVGQAKMGARAGEESEVPAESGTSQDTLETRVLEQSSGWLEEQEAK